MPAPIVATVVAVMVLLGAEYLGSQRGIMFAKPLASAAFIWAALANDALDSTYGLWILAGLALCMLGDVLLIPRGRSAVFRAGVFAFLLGHVAYAAAFLTQPLAAAGLIVGGLLLAAIVVLTLRWLRESLPADLVWPVRIYMVVIGVMTTLACGVTAAGGSAAVAAGALAFTVSDISVARDRFVRNEFLNRAWGLPLYYGAQLLLASTV
jgi:uncharacterized membrane protein YhhN